MTRSGRKLGGGEGVCWKVKYSHVLDQFHSKVCFGRHYFVQIPSIGIAVKQMLMHLVTAK